ncbi:hypothetical protein [Schlesneria sp. T3-172]|uniref:hypothetical protein n=1 Tax=Schlesneria sphaerica TaxID=3373610 RepID=UPI0037C981DB
MKKAAALKPSKATKKPVKKAAGRRAKPRLPTQAEIDAAMPVAPKVRVLNEIEKAASSARWMVAIWRIEDGQLHLDRTTVNFPSDDCNEAIKMLQRDLVRLQ